MAHLLAIPSQTLNSSEYEVIVVCDSCTDGTYEMVCEFERMSPYPVCVKEIDFGNRSIARNCGAASASNDILIFNDDDVIPEVNLFKHFNENIKEGISGMGYSSENNDRRQRTEVDKWPLFITRNVSVYRSDFMKVGGFDKELGWKWGWEDHDLAYRLEALGVILVYMPEARIVQLWNEDDEVRSLETNRAYLVRKYGQWPPRPLY